MSGHHVLDLQLLHDLLLLQVRVLLLSDGARQLLRVRLRQARLQLGGQGLPRWWWWKRWRRWRWRWRLWWEEEVVVGGGRRGLDESSGPDKLNDLVYKTPANSCRWEGLI